MSNSYPHPEVSVIITTYQAQKTVSTCLDSLIGQVCDIPFEIIVIDSSTDRTPEIVKQYPQVRMVHFDSRKYCGDARNAGIRMARADILACLDADCIVDPAWITRIDLAHQSPHKVIGGSIANALPAGLVSWAAYFIEFTPWLPGTPPGKTMDVAGANVSYKKDIFNQMGPFIEGTYCSDTEFHWRLNQAGCPVYFDPTLKVHHLSLANFWQLVRHEFQHGFSFARMRVRFEKFSSLRRLLYGLLWFLIPVKLLKDIARRVIKSRYHLVEFFACLPLIIIGLTSWSLGEGSAYLITKIVSDVPGEADL
jgi:glycosyltransferase involved in cell wall biosynthesis